LPYPIALIGSAGVIIGAFLVKFIADRFIGKTHDPKRRAAKTLLFTQMLKRIGERPDIHYGSTNNGPVTPWAPATVAVELGRAPSGVT
jgi:hypothetical protein